MLRSLVHHPLESRSSALYKVLVEPANCLFLWRGWHDNAGVVGVQLVVEPEEVAVSSSHGEFGLAVGFGGGLGDDRIDSMARASTSNGMWVANNDVERGLSSLLN